MRARRRWPLVVSALAVLAAVGLVGLPHPGAQGPPHRDALRAIYKELVEIDTTDSNGDNTKAAEAMARHLLAADIPAADVQVLAPVPRKGNMVARLRGTGARPPILLLAHLDVVEAKKSDWSVDPFTLLERDGYFYGRGTGDDKAMAAIFVANLIRYKQEGYTPDRDIIVALTADEEGGGHNGVRWLLANHRPLIDAALAINEGGGGAISRGRYVSNSLQASEKIVQSFRLEVKNKGGHSSLPVKENAIYRLANGLARLGQSDFPVHLDEVNRSFFERTGASITSPLGADMRALARGDRDPAMVARVANAAAIYNARMRTTCVATRLEAGHANNALPQTATAVVNCRVLPGETREQTQSTLAGILADEQIAITPIGPFFPSPPSPLQPEVMRAVEAVTAELWPGVPVVPVMGTGATDSKYLRAVGIPAYGTSGLFSDVDDVRAHGKDERVPVKSLWESQEYLYRLVKRLSSP